MPRQSKKAPPEYRDTFDFRAFPEYTYTRLQNLRLRLFQGRVEHWKKAVNYAASFQEDNRINLLYMIGCHPSIKPYVDKLEGNLAVLCAKVPPELLAEYDAYWDLVRKFRASGYADRDGILTLVYYTDREKRERYPEHFLERREEDKIIDRYAEVSEKILECFDTYTLIDRRGPERPFSHKDLDKLVLSWFPYGREHCGVGEKSVKSIGRVEQAVEAGLARADASKLLDLPAGLDSYTACKKGIRRCEMNLRTALRRDGYKDLRDLLAVMKKPPYGWGADAHAAYCLGYAMSGVLEDTWMWDGISLFRFADIAGTVLRNLTLGTFKNRLYVLTSEPGFRLSDRFAAIFDVTECEMTPLDATDEKILALYNDGRTERQIADELGTMSNVAVHKRIARMRRGQERLPFHTMSNRICFKIAGETRWPVALLDPRLQKLLRGYDDLEGREYPHVSVPVFGVRSVREELSYFTWERCRALRRQYRNINTIVPDMLRRRFGADIDLEAIQKYCTVQTSGWLWTAETFWDCVDKYLKKE